MWFCGAAVRHDVRLMSDDGWQAVSGNASKPLQVPSVVQALFLTPFSS
jgi:hypothetical protein